MTDDFLQSFQREDVCRDLIDRIDAVCHEPVQLMEVCGTHTMAVFRHGLRSLLPENLRLISGPGCPVCVTDQSEIDAIIHLAAGNEVILATFGDLMRVPGADSSLQKQKARGADVRIVYSPLDALKIAKDNPDRRIVFAGVGFETTVPMVAASILAAKKADLGNYFVFSAHKTVPPALEFLMNLPQVNIDGFLLPGHVSAIIGRDGYRPFHDKHPIPAAIAGFEPADILLAVLTLVSDVSAGKAGLTNCYRRVVPDNGNPKARRIIDRVFAGADAVWRGLGTIPGSGLQIRETFAAFDAGRVFDLPVAASHDTAGCICGKILTGLATPMDCPRFKTACTPLDPIGPCMVSSEGTCAAYYRYHPS